jgi:hypothetical protein
VEWERAERADTERSRRSGRSGAGGAPASDCSLVRAANSKMTSASRDRATTGRRIHAFTLRSASPARPRTHFSHLSSFAPPPGDQPRPTAPADPSGNPLRVHSPWQRTYYPPYHSFPSGQGPSWTPSKTLRCENGNATSFSIFKTPPRSPQLRALDQHRRDGLDFLGPERLRHIAGDTPGCFPQTEPVSLVDSARRIDCPGASFLHVHPRPACLLTGVARRPERTQP